MQKVNTAELRRLWAKAEAVGGDGRDLAIAMNTAYLSLPALLDELEAAREALSQIYWKSIELGDDRGDSTINHIAADALKGDTSPLAARDRRMKAIGAAEELERLVEVLLEDLADMNQPEFASRGEVSPGYCQGVKEVADGLTDRAAKLRQEAEGK